MVYGYRILFRNKLLILLTTLTIGTFIFQSWNYGFSMTPRQYQTIPKVLHASLKDNLSLSSDVMEETETCLQTTPIVIRHIENRPNNTCDAKFCSTIEGNKRKIASYNFEGAEPYLRELAPNPKLKVIYHNKSQVELPVVVSGASHNHHKEALLLIEHINTFIRPKYNSMPFYFFDLGLVASEKQKIQNACNCTVVKFPFEKYPAYVRQLKAFCWKPIIIKMMLQSYRFVMWMDTSIRFKTADLNPLFQKAKRMGVLSRPNPHRVLTSLVHEDTFVFLQEPPCLYRQGAVLMGGFLLFHSEHKLITDYIVKPFVSCALIEQCMKTTHEPKELLQCPGNNFYHGCHRYDQAVLSVLILRLFTTSARDHEVEPKYMFVDRNSLKRLQQA